MTATCPVCHAEQSEGLLCHADTSRLERELGDVAAIVGELDTTMSRQARIGNGGKSGKGSTHEKWPINVGAMEAADNLANVLTTWARDVSGNRWSRSMGAIRIYRDPLSRYQGPLCLGYCWQESCNQMETFDNVPVAPPAVQGAAQLLSTVDAIRRHPAVEDLVDEITDAIAQARRAVDRPADRTYLGQCMVEMPDDDGRQVTCLAELWARPNASEVRCTVCGSEHPVAERRVWLLRRASDMLVSVKEASSYLGEIGGIKVTESSVRGYLHRGRLGYRAPAEAKRFRLGDLLDVVMDESERKSA